MIITCPKCSHSWEIEIQQTRAARALAESRTPQQRSKAAQRAARAGWGKLSAKERTERARRAAETRARNAGRT